MKKQIAIALTIALMGLPLSTSVTLADTNPTVVVTDTTTDQTAPPATDTTTDQTAPPATDTTTDQTAPPATDTTTDQTTLPAEDTTTDQTTSSAIDITDDSGDQGTSPVVDDNGSTVDPGTTPDSPFYWLQELIQKLQVILTFDPAKKAELVQQQALQDLAAADQMTDEGKTDDAQKALTHYADKVAKAQDFLEQVKDPESDQYKELETALANTNAKNVQVLSGLLDKLPANASQHVALNIVRSMEKAVKKMNKEQRKQLRKGMENAVNDMNDGTLDDESKVTVQSFMATLNTDVEQEQEQDQDQSSDQTSIAPENSTQTTGSAVKAERAKGEQGKLQRQNHAQNPQMNKNQVQKKQQDQDEDDQDMDEQSEHAQGSSFSKSGMNQQPGNGYGRMKSEENGNGKNHR